MVLRLAVTAVGIALFGVLAGAAVAAPSPIGLWKAENGRTYRWAALPGGGYGEYAMTAHRTSKNRCLVKPNTLVYRYHPLGGGLFRTDSFIWQKGCSTHWSLNETTLKITVTATRMTHSCNKQYAKVCWTYTRARDTQTPRVQAVDSEGTVDGVTSLRYVVSDDSGRTWEALYVYRDGAVVSRYRTTLGPAVKGRMYAYRLDATPASFRGTFRFCVQSHDAAGNVSKPSCAKVRVR